MVALVVVLGDGLVVCVYFHYFCCFLGVVLVFARAELWKVLFVGAEVLRENDDQRVFFLAQR